MDQVTLMALAVGDDVSVERLRLYAAELQDIPAEWLELGFRKVRRQWKFNKLPTPGAIREAVGQGYDGRPEPQEAWGRMPKGERCEEETVVWSDEERDAYNACRPLLIGGDEIGARMCFLEKYKALVDEARIRGVVAVWSVSCGYDPSHRVLKLAEAVNKKRIPLAYAASLVPMERVNEFSRLLPPAIAKGLLPSGDAEQIKSLPGFQGLLQKMREDPTMAPHLTPPAPKPKPEPISVEESHKRKRDGKKRLAEWRKANPNPASRDAVSEKK